MSSSKIWTWAVPAPNSKNQYFLNLFDLEKQNYSLEQFSYKRKQNTSLVLGDTQREK